jgi:uncharacterized protein (TIGR02118 family)
MIKLSVMYPYAAGARFDFDYYRDSHMPMIKQRMGAALLAYSVEKGLSGVEPGSSPMYAAVGNLYCESLEVFMAALGPHAEEFGADVVNFTGILPVQQISEVVVEWRA